MLLHWNLEIIGGSALKARLSGFFTLVSMHFTRFDFAVHVVLIKLLNK